MIPTPRLIAASLAAAALFAAVVAAPAPAAAAAPARAGYKIAVMDFLPGTADDELAPLGKGLQSMLTTDLAAVDGFELVERSRLEDVVGELKLGKSGLVDAKTAAKLGKLVAASHLVVGTFTVVGKTMRLDARLVAVKNGKVELAAQSEGDKDAFFELEKALVNKLVGALGVDLAPKERAKLGKIHTADFEAFRAFSTGIDLFDQKQYDAAVEALRKATVRDADFQLAALTLGEYERVIGELRTKAETLTQARDEAERMKRLAARSDEAKVVARLFEIAGDPSKAHQKERLAALYALGVAYGNIGSNLGKLSKVRAADDRFAMQRTADAMAKRYFAEARDLYPKVPVCLEEQFFVRLPEEPGGVDKWLAREVDALWGKPKDLPENRERALSNNVRANDVRTMARLLGLDAREATALHQELFDRSKKFTGDFILTEQLDALADEWRAVLDLDRSTAILRAQAAATDKPHLLEKYADDIELNRDIAQALGEVGKLKPWLEEYLSMIGPSDNLWRKEKGGAWRGDALTADVLARLARDRKLPIYSFSGGMARPAPPQLVNAHPVWVVQTGGSMWAGLRAPTGRTDSLRSYQSEGGEGRLGIVVVDGVPRDALTAAFTIVRKPAADWWPPGAKRDTKKASEVDIADGKPTVAFAFGMVDIDVAKEEVEGSKERVVTRPMRFAAVTIAADGKVRLVRATESGRAHFGKKAGFSTEVVGEKKVSAAKGDKVPVTVSVGADATLVRVGGEQLSFPAIGERMGFYGFWLDGAGYVALDGLAVTGR
ncbi:MAG: hypothetical protein H6745_16805 [Deltaproteobacteria bacterium]|nr:hypothetical protein [Deltaproteobacteria bacterium]